MCFGSAGDCGPGSAREDLSDGGEDGHHEGDDPCVGTYAGKSHCGG